MNNSDKPISVFSVDEEGNIYDDRVPEGVEVGVSMDQDQGSAHKSNTDKLELIPRMERTVFNPNTENIIQAIQDMQSSAVELYSQQVSTGRNVKLVVSVKKDKLASITTSTTDEHVIVVFDLIV